MEDKRKEINAPANEFIKSNNELAKSITEEAIVAITGGKQKLLAYDEIKEAEAAKAQAKIDEENRKKAETLEKETNRKNGILSKIANLVKDAERDINQAIEAGDRATSLTLLTKAKQTYLDSIDKTAFDEFQNELEVALAAILEMGKKATNDVRSGVYEKATINESAMDALENAKEIVEEENYEQSEDLTKESFSSAVSVTHDKASYRTDWKAELIDITKVPAQFLSLNTVAVNAWIKNLKEAGDPALVDGNIVHGLKIVKTKTATLR